jgi:hypothetical protein
MEPYYAKRKVHTLKSVIEHRALTRYNSPWRHWVGCQATDKDVQNAAREVVREWTAANGANIDVHARQFTPSSFKKLILSLGGLGYISMMPVRAYPTPVSRLEFCAVLEKP